ncbi:hypothetical protein DO97_13890 [Neosynechococcus sphagnicola sy1]|uniref:Uncharacterized protein n=1 Tax=Neosynechococcus sphagnicola sy1 TaxID=1497020 RepID=A0A098TIW9_9CYAN|nr:hypothetical protein [Neosynechococcus sphagnicola]KGF71986.1 hypothetical protein DO97_13890 [Neosynechococcus sphagnicola sy1]
MHASTLSSHPYGHEVTHTLIGTPSEAMSLQRTDGAAQSLSPHQVIYQQFQSRYPTAGLIAELLQIHEGKFIVRALVQVGGSTLATGMAAAYTPELAEDQARARALEVLGIILPSHRVTPPETSPLTSACEVQVRLMTNHQSSERSAPPSNSFASREYPALQGSLLEQPIELQPSPVADPDTGQFIQTHPEMGRAEEWTMSADPEINYPETQPPHSTGNRSGKSNSPTRKTRPVEPIANNYQAVPQTASVQTAPIDLSDVIAQTSIEMKRLGWTDAQGRSYLLQTYKKRSRQQLTDAELLEFLHYLEAQTSPQESLF